MTASRDHLASPWRCCLLLLLCGASLLAGATARAEAPGRTTLLRGGWLADGAGLLDGAGLARAAGGSFTERLLDALGQRAELGFTLQPLDRAEVAAAFAAGELDFVLPALAHETLAEVGRLSQPYGRRTDILLCHADLLPLASEGVAALRDAAGRGWRLAASAGESYGAEADAILAEAEARGLVRRYRLDGEMVDALLSRQADCLLAPRLALLAALAQRPRGETFFGYQRIAIGEVTLHLLLNGATLDLASLAAIDSALETLEAEGTTAELQERAARPLLLDFAVATAWFSWFDIVGTIAFALSGVLIARAEGFSLLGAFVLSALPAVGGGVLRDLLVGREPIGILASPQPLLLVIATVLATYLLVRLRDRLDAPLRRFAGRAFKAGRWPRLLRFGTLLEVTDAVGLAAFTVVGVVVAVRVGAEPLWLWGPLCAALSGAGGGILRDLLRVGYNNPALRTSFYAEVCLCWGLLLSLAVLFLLSEERLLLLRLSVGLVVLGAFATRMLAVAYRIRSPRF